MYHDVDRLGEFYASPLGIAARRMIARRIRSRWDDVTDLDVIGLGYATPYLKMFKGEARVVAAFMPQEQGVLQWPRGGPYQSALVPEAMLPLRDMSVDRVLVIHGLEHAEARQDYLREIWRVLMPQGRLIVVVPNRRGTWAGSEKTPFGHGRPYSSRQLEKLLDEAMLQPVGMTPCLFVPPFLFRRVGPAASAWEKLGEKLWPAFSGVIIMEAIKQVYAGVHVTVKKPQFARIPVLTGLNPAAGCHRQVRFCLPPLPPARPSRSSQQWLPRYRQEFRHAR